MKQKSVFLMIAVLLGLRIAAAAQTPPSYVPTNGLVAYYPLDGNGNDLSGYSNHLTPNGNLSYTTNYSGLNNSACHFPNGNDYFLTPTESWSLINNFPQGSVSFWVKIDSQYTSGHYFGIGNSFLIKQKNGVGEDLFFGMQDGTTKIRMQISGIFPSIPGTDVIGATSLETNTWYHITGVWDGVHHTLYVNGVQDGQITNSIGMSDRPLPDYFSIGSIVYGSGNGGANGSMDDIGIWNRALTPEEIAGLYYSAECTHDLSLTSENTISNLGSTVSFSAITSDTNPVYTWQTDLGQGFQNVVDYGSYSGASTSTLTISDLQLNNHIQPIRVISTSGSCIDTSAVAVITITDTCITNVIDTSYITVTDTLIINLNPTGFNPVTYANTILMYPNPTSEELTINYGDFASLAGYTLKIFNSIGQEIHSANINQQQEVLPLGIWGGAGTYQVVIYNAQGVPVDTRTIVLQD
jgi:hypothetical protein